MGMVGLMETIEEMLIRHEGFVSHAYQDSLGYWTIGVGRLIDKRRGGGITRNEAIFLLQNDITNSMNDLDTSIPWWRDLDANRQKVLIDMCFNLGINGLLGFKNTLKLIQDGKYKEAAKAMRQSLWYRQVTNRAEELAKIMADE